MHLDRALRDAEFFSDAGVAATGGDSLQGFPFAAGQTGLLHGLACVIRT